MTSPRNIDGSPVVKSVLIYACAFAVAGATPFLLLPFLTKHLSPQEFGQVTAFLMLTAMIGSVAGLSSHGFVAVRYFKAESGEFRGIVGSTLLAVGVAHVVTALIVITLFPLLNKAFDLSFGTTMFAVLAAFFLSLNLIFLALFQSAGQPLMYLRARLVQGSIEVLLCLGLLFALAAGANARIWSYAAALAASALVGLLFCLRNGYLGRGASRRHLRALAMFGMPMLPHIVSGTAITYLDRLLVTSLLGVESLGIYMVAMQIGMAMIAVIEPLNKALAPWLFGKLADNAPGTRAMIVRRTYQFHAALAALGVLVAVVAHVLFDELIGARYAPAKALIPWMVGGFVLQGMYYSVVNYLFYAEKTGRLSVMSTLTAIVGCAVSYALVSSLGLVGAGASFLINNAILFLSVWFAASKAVAMPWRLGG